jgi:hypothetical protein
MVAGQSIREGYRHTVSLWADKMEIQSCEQSGFGREFGLLGLESFLEPKAIIGGSYKKQKENSYVKSMVGNRQRKRFRPEHR